jgi:hypothetical protein
MRFGPDEVIAMRALKLVLPASFLMSGFLVCTTASYGRPEYSKKEKTACSSCHGTIASSQFTAANLNETGTYYKTHDHNLGTLVPALQKEVQSLKAELAALRAQIQQGGSTPTPVASGSGSTARSDGARPSQAEVQTCIDSSRDGSITLMNRGPLEQLQFGTPTSSQGGMMELALGAANGTTIFPAKYILRTTEGSPFERTIWIFKDSFGKWRCAGAK